MQTDRNSRLSINNIIIYLLLIATLLIIFFASGFAKVNWGMNQVSFISPALYSILLGMAIAMLAWIVFRPGQGLYWGGSNDWLYGSRKIFGRGLFLIAALAIFLIFRFQAHLYDSGYLRLAYMAQREIPVIPWYEFGGTFLPYLFYRIISLIQTDAIAAAVWGYQISSFLSGLIYIWMIFKISELLSDSFRNRLAFVLLTFFSGISILSFGMVSPLPPLLPAIAAVVYIILKWHRIKSFRYFYYLWGIVILGTIVNIQFLAVVPAVIYISILKFYKEKATGKLAVAISVLSGVIGVAVLYIWAGSDIGVANRILLLSGKMPDSGYSLFSARHLLDLLNILFLLIPLWLIFLYFMVRMIMSSKLNTVTTALFILAGSQLILLFIIDPNDGMARDFNFYAFPLVGLLLTGAYAVIAGVSKDSASSPRPGFQFCLLGLILAVPMFVVHLTPAATVTYLDRFLQYNDTKLESALLAYRDYYFSVGNYTEADRREQEINGKVQDALQSRLVNDLFYHKRTEDAFSYASQLVTHNPYNATYRMQLGNLYKYYKKYPEAEKELKIALKLDPYRPELYHFLADFYRETNEPEKSYSTIEDGLRVDPKNSSLLTDLTYYYYHKNEFAKTDSLCEVMMARDTAAYYAYLYKGLVAEHMGQYRQALDYYTKFTRNDNLPEYGVIMKRMNSITQMLSDSTKNK
ncbi:membrane hypothetical protein [Candidatus Zixiibacteriota bacterium]|nr:membrane hypothetical protein [candidate division Zixibacteria bacterium]